VIVPHSGPPLSQEKSVASPLRFLPPNEGLRSFESRSKPKQKDNPNNYNPITFQILGTKPKPKPFSGSTKMAIADQQPQSQRSEAKVWGLFKLPFRHTTQSTSSSSSSSSSLYSGMSRSKSNGNPHSDGSNSHSTSSVSSVARSLMPSRRRLRLDPPTKLYFPCRPSLLLSLCS